MRTISPSFINELKNGFLSPLIKLVNNDTDLDLQFRENYINIYYKGHSILNLNDKYEFKIHPKISNNCFTQYGNKKVFSSAADVKNYMNAVPELKTNICNIKSVKSSIEIEYEQLIIRSNNYNKMVNSEIFITDRQFASSKNNSRFDLSGVLWKRERRRKNQTVPLVFIEVKYSLNSDIKDLHMQIQKYYNTVKNGINIIAAEAEASLHLKAELELIKQSKAQLQALKTLKVSNNIDDAMFIIALIDYNPYSKLFSRHILNTLSFHNQIKLFNCGFGIWDHPMILK